jgi:hypothetical protein
MPHHRHYLWPIYNIQNSVVFKRLDAVLIIYVYVDLKIGKGSDKKSGFWSIRITNEFSHLNNIMHND